MAEVGTRRDIEVKSDTNASTEETPDKAKRPQNYCSSALLAIFGAISNDEFPLPLPLRKMVVNYAVSDLSIDDWQACFAASPVDAVRWLQEIIAEIATYFANFDAGYVQPRVVFIQECVEQILVAQRERNSQFFVPVEFFQLIADYSNKTQPMPSGRVTGPAIVQCVHPVQKLFHMGRVLDALILDPNGRAHLKAHMQSWNNYLEFVRQDRIDCDNIMKLFIIRIFITKNDPRLGTSRTFSVHRYVPESEMYFRYCENSPNTKNCATYTDKVAACFNISKWGQVWEKIVGTKRDVQYEAEVSRKLTTLSPQTLYYLYDTFLGTIETYMRELQEYLADEKNEAANFEEQWRCEREETEPASLSNDCQCSLNLGAKLLSVFEIIFPALDALAKTPKVEPADQKQSSSTNVVSVSNPVTFANRL